MTRIIIEIDGKEASSTILQPASNQGAQSEAAASSRSDTDAGAAPMGITASVSETAAAMPAISDAIDAGASRERRAGGTPAKRSARRK